MSPPILLPSVIAVSNQSQLDKAVREYAPGDVITIDAPYSTAPLVVRPNGRNVVVHATRQSHIQALGGLVFAYDASKVTARGTAQVIAYNATYVHAQHGVTVWLTDDAHCAAVGDYRGITVVAYKRATVAALASVTVWSMEPTVRVRRYGGEGVKVLGPPGGDQGMPSIVPPANGGRHHVTGDQEWKQ